MSDIDFDNLLPDPDDDDNGNPRIVQLKRQDIRRMTHSAKEARREANEAKAELETLRRERAFVMAGIPMDDPAVPFFVKGYEGEMTPDAIRAAAVVARIPVSGSNPATPGEIAGHQAAQAAQAGAEPPSAQMDEAAQLAEFAKAKFTAIQEEDRQAHIERIAQWARERNIRIPL